MIRWPERYHPDVAPVHVRNEIVSPAPAEALWAWLVRAALWPSWYPNSSRMEFLEGDPPDLALGTLFRWRTFGVTITSRVVEFVPGERIAWSADGMGVDAYHAWLLQPAEGGTRVLTEETQYGWLARTGDLVLPRRMGKHHQIWLEALSRQAQSGFPPNAT
ncbi:MAG: SRPBCC domain-containing protein [Gemmatimonadetes bacterium]|nr:SRPBCC domain-containing protein [Gemmatimonadota bacterium]